MDREHCLMILEGYGTGPNMIRLIRNFWANTIMISAKLFNILVDALETAGGERPGGGGDQSPDGDLFRRFLR